MLSVMCGLDGVTKNFNWKGVPRCLYREKNLQEQEKLPTKSLLSEISTTGILIGSCTKQEVVYCFQVSGNR